MKMLQLTVLAACSCSSTPEFSAASLERIRVRMTKRQALGVLGTPLQAATDRGSAREVFRYAEISATGTNYHVVVFDNGRVDEYGPEGREVGQRYSPAFKVQEEAVEK